MKKHNYPKKSFLVEMLVGLVKDEFTESDFGDWVQRAIVTTGVIHCFIALPLTFIVFPAVEDLGLLWISISAVLAMLFEMLVFILLLYLRLRTSRLIANK